jgi:NDP-sugar pyrophosphorylase family protein
MHNGAIMDFDTTPVLLLAGGKATRLGDISKSVPKALVPVAGRPFIDHQLERLHDQGIREVILCVGHLSGQIRSHLGSGSRFGLRIRYADDGPHPLGTGGAVRNALHLIGAGCWILYGDSLLDVDYRHVFAAMPKTALGLMTVFCNENRYDASNVLFRNGRLVKYSKTEITPDMMHIDYGLSLLRSAAIERIPANQQFDLAELYSQLSTSGEIVGIEIFKRFHEIGTPSGLQETEEFLRRAA